MRVAVVVEFGQPRRAGLEKLDRGVERCRACGPGRRAPRGAPRPPRARGAGLVEVGEVAGEGLREIRGAVAEVGGLRGELVERRVVRRARARDALSASSDADVGRVAVAREDLVGGRGRQPQLFGVREPLGAHREVGVLPRLRCSLLDLGDRGAQLLGLAGARIAIGR